MLDNIQTGKEFFGDVSKPNKTGEKAMKSFGGGFAKIVLVFLLLVGASFADVPKTEIVATGQVKDYVKNLPQQEQKFVNKAIEVGNKFAALHIGNESFYDEEIEDSWNKKFTPMMTLSGDEWRNLWTDNLDEYSKKNFSRWTCDKVYLKDILFDGNRTMLKYETLVFGMDGSFQEYKYVKLNERLIFELELNKTPKIVNVRFDTKDSNAGSPKWKLKWIRKDIKELENAAPKYKAKNLESYKKWHENTLKSHKMWLKNIEEASYICKDY